jgi:phosphatidate cytidylyltransferase
MSDDMWRDRRDPDDFSEFGSLFDDAEPTQNMEEVVKEKGDNSDRLSFGTGDTGSLPHWTEPATGEIPRLDVNRPPAEQDHGHEDVDVWSSFSSDSPVWKDDEPVDRLSEMSEPPSRRTGQTGRVTGQTSRVTGESDAVPREPSRITIGTDPSGMPRRPPTAAQRRRGAPAQAPSRARTTPPAPKGRDMPAAIAVGLFLAAVFIAALMWDRRVGVVVVVTAILGLAAVEFYDKVSEKGYRPAIFPGIATCVAAPLAAYWLGDVTLPLVLAFGFMATAGSFIGARSVEAGPMPNVSITTLGIVWIGLLGSFAMLILRFSTESGSDLAQAQNRGTDTLFLLALGVVANDVGALLVGSSVGKTSLRHWISPHKTVEGLIGGSLMTIIAMILVNIADRSDTWTSLKDLILLAIVISVMAPMGDLVESMFKRNLDVKDFGSIVKGHGGILDRFDGFLFVLPAVYYLTVILEPWTARV